MAKNVRKKPKKKRKPLNPKAKKGITALLALAFTALVSLVIVCTYLIIYMVSYVNGEAKIDIADYKENQAQTTIVYAYNSNDEAVELTRLHGEQNRVWTSIDEIPESLQKAYIALEDKRFEKHSGVDWIRTLKAVITFGKSGGGSTLTQQLIKNLTGENGKTVSRKFYEILNALNLEKNASKATILEAYMNTVYMSHGCYGVKTTAEKYFGKDLSELNIAECASIAAITQNPSTNDPLLHPEANRKRQLTCLRNMLKEGYISQEEYDEAVAYEMVFTNSENYVKKDSSDDSSNASSAAATEIQSYYVDYVIQSVINDLVSQCGYTKSQASKLIYNGGLRIYSAVDTSIQEQLEDVYVNKVTMPAYNKNVPDAQSAMTIMDYSGRILAMVGGIGEKTENRGLNRATTPRQPGSSIKPLSIYAPAIEEKYVTWSTKIQNYGIAHYYSDGGTGPVNYGNDPGSPDSYVTVQHALCVSYNTVPAQILKQMGVDLSYKYATEKFRLSYLDESDKNMSSLAVGGASKGVTTVQMAAAFAAFGNGGKYYEPYCYYKVTNANGTKIYLQHQDSEGEQVISPDTADVMNKLLQTVVTDAAHMATARNYGISGFETFAKTGTTSDDKDRWFVGGTPYYVAAVWYGCDMPKQLSAYVSGSPSGKIFDEVMTRIHKGLTAKPFDTHSNLVMSATYCTQSGFLASESCTSTATGWYTKSNLPGHCTSCAATPSVAEPVSEGETVVSDQQTPETTAASDGDSSDTPPATAAPENLPPAE
jgi:penicillin-binding protein 1A